MPGLFSSCTEPGLLSSCRVWASHRSGFSSFGPQALGSARFSSGGTWAQWVRLPGSSESESHSVMPDSLRPHGLYSPWNSPGQNTGVGSLSLLQGIFPTQGLNPGLLHCQWLLYQLSHKGSPRILERVPSPANLPNLGIKPGSPALQADSLPTELSGKSRLNSCGSPGA